MSDVTLTMNRHQRRKLLRLMRVRRCLYRRCGSTRVTVLTGKHGNGSQCHKRGCGRRIWARGNRPKAATEAVT